VVRVEIRLVYVIHPSKYFSSDALIEVIRLDFQHGDNANGSTWNAAKYAILWVIRKKRFEVGAWTYVLTYPQYGIDSLVPP
jgi:hypothetical protein